MKKPKYISQTHTCTHGNFFFALQNFNLLVTLYKPTHALNVFWEHFDFYVVREQDHFSVTKGGTVVCYGHLRTVHIWTVLIYIMYQNIRVQFSAPFWYQWPNFGPLAHGLMCIYDLAGINTFHFLLSSFSSSFICTHFQILPNVPFIFRMLPLDEQILSLLNFKCDTWS